jgi:hypothetical protein
VADDGEWVLIEKKKKKNIEENTNKKNKNIEINEYLKEF